MASSKKKPPNFKTFNLKSGIIEPVLINDNPVQQLTDHTEVQVNGEKITISMSDLETLNELGKGQFGIVEQMLHKPSNLVFAVKQLRCSKDDKKQDRILNDLNISMRSTQCPYVVVSYGAMHRGGDVWICMEILDSSLDKFYKLVSAIGTESFIPEMMLAYITFCIVTALEYLHQALRVIHRDVKPSNVLIDKSGRVKVCDFGISGTLVNSVAQTNLGTQSYLAPERIITENSTSGFTIRSDVWSLGLSILELAILKFPYPLDISLYNLITYVTEGPPPSLPENSSYSNTVRNFISRCLVIAVKDRASYLELLKHDLLKSFYTQSFLENVQNEFANYVTFILQNN